MSNLDSILKSRDITLPKDVHLVKAVILEPKKIEFLTVSIVSPSICHEMMGPDAMIFVF